MDHHISLRISIDPDVESASPDSIIRSESAKNDFFSKPSLHSLYGGGMGGFTVIIKQVSVQIGLIWNYNWN